MRTFKKFLRQWPERLLEELSNLFIAGAGWGQLVALQNAAGVGIDHKYRMIPRIEQNRIGSFWAHSIEPKQLFAERGGGFGEHAGQGTGVTIVEEPDKCFQALGFLPEVPCRANQLFQL